MRCKACDTPIDRPIRVIDPYDDKEYEEWLCKRCNKYSFVERTDGFDSEGVYQNLIADGFIRVEGLPDENI